MGKTVGNQKKKALIIISKLSKEQSCLHCDNWVTNDLIKLK